MIYKAPKSQKESGRTSKTTENLRQRLLIKPTLAICYSTVL